MQVDQASAADIIKRLSLSPHPEGGWYRQTWRADGPAGQRPGATAIHFLLEAHQRSHWHRVDAAELWLWHAGASVALSLAADDAAAPHTIVLGPDVLAGEQPQVLVPAHHWQAAAPRSVGAGDGWALVSCVVAPGFDFAGFVLAPPEWSPGEEASGD